MFDYIIVGAGSAGCVVANRLTANPGTSVLLLEAGPRDNGIWLKVPAGTPRLYSDSRVNWRFNTVPEPGLNGRRIYCPRGKTLGGSSSINGLVYMRGVQEDYDNWRQLGNAGWGWSDVLPSFIRTEHYHGEPSPLRGKSGELGVSPLTEPHAASRRFVESAVNTGLQFNPDFNGGQQEGAGFLQYTTQNGIRSSASKAFLDPVRRRRNLRIETGVRVERLILDGKRVVGVKCKSPRGIEEFHAREVILSAGSIGSPQILMVSGIGSAGSLRELGIEVLHDLPGVGQNLHDHVYVHMLARVFAPYSLNKLIRKSTSIAKSWQLLPHVMQYMFSGKGLLASAAAQAAIFAKSHSRVSTPDIQVQFRPFSMFITQDGAFGSEADPTVTASCTVLRPMSRGQITLASPDTAAAPAILFNYLSEDADMEVLVQGVKWIRKVFGAKPFSEIERPDDRWGKELVTDDELKNYIRANAQAMYHPVGSCKMGSDPLAVVNSKLQVRGLEGIRVVDASIMPQIVSGNTNAPTIMIADRACQLICEDRLSALPSSLVVSQ